MPLRAGYPTSWGNKRASVVVITGPASYTQYTAPTTGGQLIDSVPNGVKGVDFAIGSVSSDGLHRAEVVAITSGPAYGQTVARCGVILKWYVVATGAEVAGGVDLSTKTIDLLLVGVQ